MRFGVCASYSAIERLQDISFDYLEENVQRFLMPEQSQELFEEIWRQARKLPLPIEAANSMFPVSLPLIDTPTQQVDKARVTHYVQTALQRAEQVGIRVIVFGSGSARKRPADYDYQDSLRQLTEQLVTWSGWAQQHGVQIALEPLSYAETNIFNTVAESGALVAKIAPSGASLLVDTYHMACNGEAPGDILTYVPFIAHVHVAEKRERAAPGRYQEDFRPYFRPLRQGGYDRRISIECNWQDLSAEVGPAIATLRQQWDSSSV